MEQSITLLMSADHQLLDELWHQCLEGIEHFDVQRVRDRFNRLAHAWQRHMRVEEEIFFAAYSEHERSGAAALIADARAEHREIAAMLERLSPLMTARDHSTMTVIVASQPCSPTTVFQSHQVKEQDVLYPMMDRAIAHDEKLKLLEQAHERLALERS
jgi:iron-sulfur cluster repair protein YtfE (RIC family)